MGAIGCLQPVADCQDRAGWRRLENEPVPSEPLMPAASADSPGVGIGLREAGDTKRADDDPGVSWRHAGPENLLDVVDPIEVAGGPHVAAPLAAIGSDDDQVEVVLEHVAGGVGPDERDLERRPKAHCADPNTSSERAFAVEFAGDLDDDRVFVTLLERPTFAEAGIRVRTGDYNGPGKVDPAEPRVVVG